MLLQILSTLSLIVFCSSRDGSTYVREEHVSYSFHTTPPSPIQSSKRSKRAKPLEPEEMIPVPEGSKNPDVAKTISTRSEKSKRLRKCKEMNGFILERDKSVRRLGDGSRYQSQITLRRQKINGEDGNLEEKSASEKGKKKKKNEKEEVPKKEVSQKSESKKSGSKKKSKKSTKSEKEKATKSPISPKPEKKEEEEIVEEKPSKMQKIRKPWRNLFKRKKPKTKTPIKERCGTWA